MKLKNKYVVGVHVMFYEIEMLSEYIDSCISMLQGVDNHDTKTFKDITIEEITNELNQYITKIN